MSERKTLCMGCMEQINEAGVCPFCGYSDPSAYNPSYLAPKTVLDGRYIVGKLLSFNGESALYIGYDNISGDKVFVKEYMPDALCTRSKTGPELCVEQGSIVQYKNYMSEFVELNKSLSRLRTMSHIVAPIDMFSQNNTAYVILQYTEAVTLKQYLADNAGELTWEQVKKLFPPLLTTLSCVHNSGILHRGISLETVLVTDRGELKLTGFSIAAVRTVNTDLAPELYAGYSAPEQYSASEWEGTWTDVYGVAAVMYRLLTGCMPTEPMARVGRDSLLEPAKINSHVPANVSKVIMQAMRLSCETRIHTVTDFVTKLFEQPSYMDKLPAGSTQTIPIQKPQQPSRSKKKKSSNAPAIIGAVILVTIVAVVFIMLASLFLPDNSQSDVPDNTQGSSDIVTNTPVSTDTPQSSTPSISNEPITSSQPTGNAFVMPELIGKKLENVINSDAWKERLNFDVIYDYSDSYESGIIFDQDIDQGTMLYPVTTVKIFVSKGYSIVKIPSFIDEFGMNMTKDEYIVLLDALNIKYEIRDIQTPYDLSGYVLGVYCQENGSEVGGDINVAEGYTLFVDVSVFTPGIEIVG